MGSGKFCLLVLGCTAGVASLALMCVSIATDYWYVVESTTAVNITIKQEQERHFGLWQICYNNVPKGLSVGTVTSKNCVYRDLVRRNEHLLSSEELQYINLERSHVGCIVACAALQLSVLLAMLCGLWQGNCRTPKKTTVYLASSVIGILAVISGIAGCICFIALRDLDSTSRQAFPAGFAFHYDWSFMIAWASVALSFIQSFLFLILVRVTIDDTYERGTYSYFEK